MTGWRECADPVELAAAVAARVEVQYRVWHQNYYVTADEFAASGLRYRVPASWSWSPEPPAPVTGDDLRERIARAAACAYMRVPVEAMDPRIIIEPMWPEVADAVLAVLPPQPATSPVPPWPGAVLSGLCDEDGVPTWLARAGQVRGEQVRARTDRGWDDCDGYIATAWVEVRAPRAAPEPETERVSWWEAVGREVFDQDGERVTIEHVQCGDGAGPSVTAYNAAERRDTSLLRVPITVRGDGTVEVLKDCDR